MGSNARDSIEENVVGSLRIRALERGLGAQAQQRSIEVVGNTLFREVLGAPIVGDRDSTSWLVAVIWGLHARGLAAVWYNLCFM